jgi:sugar transferase (PEP-CTERM/EpsH1 system associated)
MRLLFLTHRLPYAPNRGDRIRAFHLLRVIAREHEVHLLSLVHDREEAAQVDGLRGVAASVVAVPVSRAARLATAAFALATQRPLTHVLLHSPAVAPALRALVSRAAPDAVLAYCTAMARYAMEPPLEGVPWVLDMVDVDSEKWATLAAGGGPMAAIYGREARLLRAFERRAMHAATATTVVSERERVLLGEVVPDVAGSVVPNGIDFDAFRPPGPPAAAPAVIFCGVFNYGPNETGAIWLAKEVWPLVTREIPDATLWLVGMHPTKAVRALADDPTIRVTGAVPTVQPFLWQSAVAAAPLLLARGIQNKVLEALAAGLPCVVTPQVMEGLPEGIRGACREASGAAAFSTALVALLKKTPEERRDIAALADLDRLGWELQLTPMLRLLERAAGRMATRP